MSIVDGLAAAADVFKVMLGGVLALEWFADRESLRVSARECTELLDDMLPQLRVELEPPTGVIDGTAMHEQVHRLMPKS